jgi:rubrerythrin
MSNSRSFRKRLWLNLPAANVHPLREYHIVIETTENKMQCCSCEKVFKHTDADNCCPYCGSGNWVFGFIDDYISQDTK